MVVTVLPSPNGVGLTEVTRTRLPCGFEKRSLSARQLILATPFPIGVSSWAEMPSFQATASIGSMLAARAISRSEAIGWVRLIGSLKPSPGRGAVGSV